MFMLRNASAAVLMRSVSLLHKILEPTDTDLVFSASIRTRSFGAVNENGIFATDLIKTARIRGPKLPFPERKALRSFAVNPVTTLFPGKL